MDTQNMTDYLPQVRCTPEMKASLKDIARRSVAPNIADHVRYAVEQYITATTPTLAHPPSVDPATADPAEITLREVGQ